VVEESSIRWMQHLETIWRRRRLVLTVGLLGSLAIAIWVWFSPPLYRAHASILLGAQRVSTPRGDAMADKGISSEMALLSSPALVKDTLRQIGGEAPPPEFTRPEIATILVRAMRDAK